MPDTLSVYAKMVPRPDSAALAAARGLSRPGDGQRAWARRQVEKIRAAWGAGRFQLLPWVDNYTDETPEIREAYHRMLAEPMVKAGYSHKVAGVAALDCQVIPAAADDPRHKQAASAFKTVLGLVGAGNKNGRKCGSQLVAHEILTGALIGGWSLCELVPGPPYRWQGDAYGKETWLDFKSKDTRRLAPVVDEFKNVVGVRSFGGPARTWEGPDLDSFVTYAHWPLYCSPTGTSDFRAVFRAAWIKHTAWQLRALGLDRYTHPYFKATCPDPSLKTAIEEALQDARGEGYIVLPPGATAEAVDLALKSDDVFHNAIQDLDREILIGISWSHLPFQEGQTTGGRGDTKTQANTTDINLYDLASTLGGVVTGQMLRPWYERNFADVEPATVVWGAVQEKDLKVEADVDDVFVNKLGGKLSLSEAYKRYGRTPPAGPDDELKGAPKPPGGPPGPPANGFPPRTPPGGGGWSPFGGEGPDAQFCGGPGSGVPGPCPGPQHDETAAPRQPAAPTAPATEEELDALSDEEHVAPLDAAFAAVDENNRHESAADAMMAMRGADALAAAAGVTWDASLAALDARGTDTTAARAALGPLRDKVREAAAGYKEALVDAYRANGERADLELTDPRESGGPPDKPEPPDDPEDHEDEGSVQDWEDYRGQVAVYEKEAPAYRAAVKEYVARSREAGKKLAVAVRRKDQAFTRLEDAKNDLVAFGDYELQDAIEPLRPPEDAGQFSDRPDDAFCGGPGSGVPGPCPGPAHDAPTHPDAHAQTVAAHAARAKARDDRRAAADRVDDVVAAADARLESASGDPDASRASFATLAGGLHTHLASAGAHPDTLAKLDDVASKGAASVGRAADKVERLKEKSDAAAGKAAEAKAALGAAQQAYDAHQAAAPDPPPDDAPDEQQAAFETAQAAWEAADEKLQAAAGKADDRDTAATEKADAAASALEDAQADLDTALKGQQDRLDVYASGVADDARAAADAEEEADPEPEPPEEFAGAADDLFCGGPGSGIPGPCPGPQHDEPHATRQPARVEAHPDARAAVKKLLGRDLADHELAALACAPPGATVRVSASGGKVSLTSERVGADGTLEFNSSRNLYKPWFGPPTCENKMFGLRGEGKGQGLALFDAQVKALQSAGVKRIVTSAAGTPTGGGNGYYTWPRMGYSAPMTAQQVGRLPPDIRKALGGKTDIRDLFDLPGAVVHAKSGKTLPVGVAAWLDHGSGLPNCTFDLTPGSRNMKALEAYKAERAKGG